MRAYLEAVVLTPDGLYNGDTDVEFEIYSDNIRMRAANGTMLSFRTNELHSLTVMAKSLTETR